MGWSDLPLPCRCSSKQHHHVLVVFVGWLNAIASHQFLLFLHEKSLDKVENEFFVSTL